MKYEVMKVFDRCDRELQVPQEVEDWLCDEQGNPSYKRVQINSRYHKVEDMCPMELAAREFFLANGATVEDEAILYYISW